MDLMNFVPLINEESFIHFRSPSNNRAREECE